MHDHWRELESLAPGELRTLVAAFDDPDPSAQAALRLDVARAAEASASFELRAELLATADALTAEPVEEADSEM